ncbi:MAG: hypothetical protein R6U11_00465 [Bacteroidales bacterium]
MKIKAKLIKSFKGMHGCLSPDGNYIAFQKWSNRDAELWLYNFIDDTSSFISISDPTVPRWSADSKLIYFGKNKPTQDVYNYNIVSGKIFNITLNNKSWGFNIDLLGNSVYCIGYRPSTKIVYNPVIGDPKVICSGWHPSILGNLVASVRKINKKNYIQVLDLKSNKIVDEFEGLLPCISYNNIIWFTNGHIPNNKIYYKNIEESPYLFSESPLRHPETRLIKNKHYLICEYAETEDSDIQVYEFFN